jgi:hypothetical protein
MPTGGAALGRVCICILGSRLIVYKYTSSVVSFQLVFVIFV